MVAYSYNNSPKNSEARGPQPKANLGYMVRSSENVKSWQCRASMLKTLGSVSNSEEKKKIKELYTGKHSQAQGTQSEI